MRQVSDLQRAVAPFEVVAEFEPSGDQPTAIDDLERRIKAGEQDVVLLGATGTGKTATVAWLAERIQRPMLVMQPNKTLAAQFANELRQFFPDNAVEYFVSYYDYYQPEAYVPQTDTYIEKDSSINEEVERLRHSATWSLLTRRDVIVVATVSCIYGLGSADEYLDRMVHVKVGEDMDRDGLLRKLVGVQYSRNDLAATRGTFRVRGDTLEVFPVYQELAVRVEFFGDEIERLMTLHPVTGEIISEEDELYIGAATHYVTNPQRMERAIGDIEVELAERLAELERGGQLLEAQRLRMRTTYDIEMMRQIGTCSGIENYSRHVDGRPAGSAPHCLLDYFPEDFLLVIDESHVTVPQIGGMYEGDMSRKRTLVEHGFRLPSAMDNRPLKWEEFLERIGQTVYLSATPGQYEQDKSDGHVEQIIRPTGLVDPEVIVKPTKGQIDDLIHEIGLRTERNERVLVTTLTKKMSEDLTDYLLEMGIRTRYLHSEVDTLRRVELLRELRLGEFDVLVGINLLREGLDLPEVSLVAILDADKEGLPAQRPLADPDHRSSRTQRVRRGVHVRRQDHPVDGAGDRRDQPAARDPGRVQHRARHRPDPAAEADRGHHRHARPGGRRHRRAARQRPVAEPRQGTGAGCAQQAEGRRARQGAGRRAAVERPGGPDPAAHRPDAQLGGRAAVRDRGPAARRDLRAEEGAPADGERRGPLVLQAVPGPAWHREGLRNHRALVAEHVIDGPLHVGPQCGPELGVVRQLRVVGRGHEARHEPPAEVGHVAVAAVQPHHRRLVAVLLGERRRPAEHLGPVRRQPLHVLRMLVRVRERVVELGIREAAGVVGLGQGEERRRTPGELEQRRSHGIEPHTPYRCAAMGRQLLRRLRPRPGRQQHRGGVPQMTYDELLKYCLAKPGAWQDEPWEGDVVAKVSDKIFAFLGRAVMPRVARSGSSAAGTGRRPTS